MRVSYTQELLLYDQDHQPLMIIVLRPYPQMRVIPQSKLPTV